MITLRVFSLTHETLIRHTTAVHVGGWDMYVRQSKLMSLGYTSILNKQKIVTDVA